MMKTDFKYRFNVIFLSFIIIWPVVKGVFLNIDAAGRTESCLMLLAVLVNGKQLFDVPRALFVWLIWIVFSLVNLYIHGFELSTISFEWWFFIHLLLPFISMLVTYKVVENNHLRSVNILFYLMLAYVILGYLGFTSEVDIATGQDRFGNAMGNSYLNDTILLLPFAALYYNTGKMKKWTFILICLFLLYLIVRSGERKALICYAIILLGIFLGKGGKLSASVVLRIGIVFFLAYWLMGYILEHTTAGMRMAASFDDTEFENNVFLKFMGDRAIMYVEGMDLFYDHIWTGVGLTNAIRFSALGHILHTEYMVQLAECGLIGSSLFFMFYFGLLKRCWLLKRSDNNQYLSIVLLASMIAILIINFVTWTYDDVLYFIFFGFVFASYKQHELTLKQ